MLDHAGRRQPPTSSPHQTRPKVGTHGINASVQRSAAQPTTEYPHLILTVRYKHTNVREANGSIRASCRQQTASATANQCQQPAVRSCIKHRCSTQVNSREHPCGSISLPRRNQCRSCRCHLLLATRPAACTAGALAVPWVRQLTCTQYPPAALLHTPFPVMPGTPSHHCPSDAIQRAAP